MQFRELLWEYPTGIIWLIKKLSFVFILVSGILTGVLLLLLVSGFLSSRQQRRIFDGTLRYGVVGTYDYVSPLETGPSDAEQMTAKLIYNSLVSIDEAGRMYPELAETWGISPDGRVYTFFLKKGVKWHDDYELTAKDVATTFNLLRSGDAETVTGAIVRDVEVKVSGTYEVTFTLSQINAAFLELMTTPILPDHIYANLTYARLQELGDSLSPIGTGPFFFKKYVGNTVFLEANSDYFKGVPSIKTLQISVYPTYELAEKAFLDAQITALAPVDISHIARFGKLEKVSKRISISPLVQANNTRLLLFNVVSSEPFLGKDLSIRQAVARAIDRAELIRDIPGSQIALGPYDKSSIMYTAELESLTQKSVAEASAILEKLGWIYPYSGAPYRTKGDQEFKLTLTYLDSETNRQIAATLQKQLSEIGCNMAQNGISNENMLQNVLPKKEFELLLFEIHAGIDPDQYGLWHSSQTNFPGLNLSGINSPIIDALLEKGRLQTNVDKRTDIYKQFQVALVKESVALFLYRPAYYEAYYDIIDRKLPQTVVDPSDRFSSVHTWKLMPGWRNWQTR